LARKHIVKPAAGFYDGYPSQAAEIAKGVISLAIGGAGSIIQR
jgi:hypothetical protein